MHSRRIDPINPFGKTVLPRRGWCDGLVADSHSANSAYRDVAIDAIAIPDEIGWCFMPRECLSQLACDPFGRWMLCNVDPDELSPVQPDDDEGIEQVETNARDNEQVHGSNLRRVVAQEGVPSLTWRSMPLGHVFGHGRHSRSVAYRAYRLLLDRPILNRAG